VEHLAGGLPRAALALDELALLLLPLPLIVIANFADRPPIGPGWPARFAAALGSAIWVLLATAAAGIVLLALFTIAVAAPGSGGGAGSILIYAGVLLVTGVIAAALVVPPVRARLARIIPVDPRSAVHATALVLTVMLVGSQLAGQLSVDVLSQQASASTAPLGPADLVAGEVPFLLAAFLGVGLFIRRTPQQAMERLGFVRPTGWQLVIALGAAGVFYAFGNGATELSHHLTPGLAHKVDAANDRLFSQLAAGPLGIATIALSAGICEEALFRGATQPRLGILWTSLVFAAVHTQYGLSLDTAAVFILAGGLGLIRRFTNTTTSATCHVVYNTLVGIEVTGALLGPALAIEAGLLLAGLVAFFTGRLGSLRTAP
jgi:membrane protease YdiL (CAAX protease family)